MFPPSGGWGRHVPSSKVVILSWEETQTTCSCFFVAEDLHRLLLGEIIPFCPSLSANLLAFSSSFETWPSGYFLLKSLNQSKLCHYFTLNEVLISREIVVGLDLI